MSTITSTTTALRIPSDLSARYEKLAQNTGRTKTFYMKEALTESIDHLEYVYGILKDVEDARAGKLETYSIEEVKAHCGLAD